MKDLRVVFMGTPSFAVPVLEWLIENTNVVLIVSQPDREKDKKGNVLPTPVKKVGIEHNIEVFQPTNIRKEYQPLVDAIPDIIITCAYGQIIPEELLKLPQYKCINVHGSLLPKLRGGAPIHHAIIDGESETGITIMYMDKKMDAGDIISQRKIKIEDDYNLDILYEKMSYLGRDLLKDTLESIIDGTNNRYKQDKKKVTYAPNITKEDERINFDYSGIEIHNLIRGLSTSPAAYCYLDDKRMKIYTSEFTDIPSRYPAGTIEAIDKTGIYVSTIDNIIKFTDIKIEGKKRCLVSNFINGIKKDDYIGKVLK